MSESVIYATRSGDTVEYKRRIADAMTSKPKGKWAKKKLKQKALEASKAAGVGVIDTQNESLNVCRVDNYNTALTDAGTFKTHKAYHLQRTTGKPVNVRDMSYVEREADKLIEGMESSKFRIIQFTNNKFTKPNEYLTEKRSIAREIAVSAGKKAAEMAMACQAEQARKKYIHRGVNAEHNNAPKSGFDTCQHAKQKSAQGGKPATGISKGWGSTIHDSRI